MREHLGRVARAFTGDWRYPAAVAALIFAAVLALLQYGQWADTNNTGRAVDAAIRQNNDLRKQLDTFQNVAVCQTTLNTDVTEARGVIVLVQGRLTATVGTMIVALIRQDQAGLTAATAQLDAYDQQLEAASTTYQDALDRLRDINNLCVSSSTTTTIASP